MTEGGRWNWLVIVLKREVLVITGVEYSDSCVPEV